MKKTVFLLMILTVVAKFIGFAREITLSYFYGASNISDAYLISLTIPTVIFGFVGAGISTSYIPIYSDVVNNKGTQTGVRFTNNVVNLLVTVSTLIIVLILAYTAPIVKLFAAGFEGDTLALAVTFTRVSVLGIYFTGIGYIYRSLLQLKENFILPTILGFSSNIIIIISIMLSSRNILVLSIGSVIAASTQVLFLLPSLYRSGYRYSLVLDFKDPYLRKIITQSIPVFFGNSVNQINRLVDRTLASAIIIGGISALNYADRLNGFVQGIFVSSIATVMYPLISKMAAEGNVDGVKGSLREAINGSNLLVVPATVGSMIFAEPIVRLLFGRGAFDAEAIALTSTALFFYSIGMVSFGLREVLSRAFYSLHDTKTPMINAVIAVIMNIVLNIILSRFMGIGGLALATSIAGTFCMVLLFINLRKKIGSFGIKSMSITFAKILFTSLLMGVIAWMAYKGLFDIIGGSLSLIAAIGIGALVYVVVIYFMKIDDVDIIVNAIKTKIRKTA